MEDISCQNLREFCNNLKGLYHEDTAVKGQFCAEDITLIIRKMLLNCYEHSFYHEALTNTLFCCLWQVEVVLTFSFRFPCLFFPSAGNLVGFILVGKVFGKTFRILGSYERKDWWVVEGDFHGNLGSVLQGFSPFSPVSSTESCLFWYG